MKTIILLLFTLVSISTISYAQHYKKDGTPDMRYRENKETYGGNNYSSSKSTYSTPSYSYGTSNDVRYQSGYVKDNGTYVEPHYKTNNNSTNWDNFSTKDNYNYYNGTNGSRAKDYSNEAQNYGGGNTINTGPKGGQYYYNDKGNKVYVPKQ